jgi:hypothetical protein
MHEKVLSNKFKFKQEENSSQVLTGVKVNKIGDTFMKIVGSTFTVNCVSASSVRTATNLLHL